MGRVGDVGIRTQDSRFKILDVGPASAIDGGGTLLGGVGVEWTACDG